MDIALTLGTDWIYLNGTGLSGVCQGCRFEGSQLASGVLQLTISLEGLPQALDAWLAAAQRLTAKAQRVYGIAGQAWGYVVVNGYRTPICTASWAYASPNSPAPREEGRQAMLLSIEKEDWWEALNEISLPLTSRLRPASQTQVVDNCANTTLENSVGIEPAALEGDSPAPARLQLRSAAYTEVLIGQDADPSPQAVLQVEGEAASPGSGVTGAPLSDPTCSEGNCLRLSWSGTAEVSLATWLFSAAQTAAYAGRLFRPVLRLRTLISSSEKFWGWLRVGYSNGLYLEGSVDFEGMLLNSNRLLQILPPVLLPPWHAPSAGLGWSPAGVSLMCQVESASAHELQLDFLQFVPMENWLRFTPTIVSIDPTEINYDSGSGALSRFSSALTSHAVEGPGLWLEPGQAQRISVLAHNANGAPLSFAESTLQIFYRPRRRTL